MSELDNQFLELVCPECGPSKSVFAQPGRKCPIHDKYYVASKALKHREAREFVGTVIGEQYLIFDRVGQGGMGSVYKAVHLKLMRIVAVKMIRSKEAVLGDVERLVERFKFEAQSLSRLSHQNIVTVYDYGETSGILYLVLEYVNGRPLSSIIRERKIIPVAQAVEWTNQLLDALGEMHRIGILHRDIKPSNIMIEEGEGNTRLVLIDFGVAKAKNRMTGDFRRDLTRKGTAVGTPLYMSPEALREMPISQRSDLYAVGVLLFHMLAGKTPFTGPSADIISAHLSRPVPPLPKDLHLKNTNEVIAKAMVKKPEDRFASAVIFKHALQQSTQLDLSANPQLEVGMRNDIAFDVPASAQIPDVKFALEPSDAVQTESHSDNHPQKGKKVSEAATDQSDNDLTTAVTEPHRVNDWPDFIEQSPSDAENESAYASAKRSILGLTVILLLSLSAIFVLNPDLWKVFGVSQEIGVEVPSDPEAVRRRMLRSSGFDMHMEKVGTPYQSELVISGDSAPEQRQPRTSIDPPTSSMPKNDAVTERANKQSNLVRTRLVRPPKRLNGSGMVNRDKGLGGKIPLVVGSRSEDENGVGIGIESRQESVQSSNHSFLAKAQTELDEQLRNCDCSGAKVTIGTLRQQITRVKWRRANERYQESCGVIGKGCRR